MAAVTICSDFGAQKNKVWHCFHCFPSISHEVMGLDAMVFVFWILSFKPTFSLSTFTLAKIKWTLCKDACVHTKSLQSCPTLYDLMEPTRQEHWSRLPRLPPGDLPDPGFELASLISSALAGVFFTTSTIWEACVQRCLMPNCWIIHKHMKDLIFNYFSNQNYSDADNNFWT